MRKATSTDSPNHDISRFRGFDFETLVATQVRGINTLQKISNTLFNSAEIVTARQADFLKSNFDRAGLLFEKSNETTTGEIFGERQAIIYREFLEASARHFSEIAEICSHCCGEMLEQIATHHLDAGPSKAVEEKSAKASRQPSKSEAS